MIRNGPKQTLSTSDGLELLQMVSKLDTHDVTTDLYILITI